MIASTILTAALLLAQPASAGDCGTIASEISRAAAQHIKKRVAVVPFQGVLGKQSYAGSVIGERLLSHIIALGAIEVVERNLLKSVMREQRLESYGIIDPNTVKALGKILGVDAIVTGTVIELKNDKVEINARLIDAQTAKVLAASIVKVDKEWSDFPVEEGVAWNVPVPELDDDNDVKVPELTGGSKSSDFWETSCGSVKEKVDQMENSLIDLKARYWALKLKDRNFSTASLKRNPGSEIANTEIRGRFYNQLRRLYDTSHLPGMSQSDVDALNEQQNKIRRLSESCKG